jgi:hypothetical protein
MSSAAASAGNRVRYDNVDSAQAHARLCGLCPPGTTVYSIKRSVTRSRLTTYLDFVVFEQSTGSVVNITQYIAAVLRLKQTDDGWIVAELFAARAVRERPRRQPAVAVRCHRFRKLPSRP